MLFRQHIIAPRYLGQLSRVSPTYPSADRCVLSASITW